jgi:hypothetical protein
MRAVWCLSYRMPMLKLSKNRAHILRSIRELFRDVVIRWLSIDNRNGTTTMGSGDVPAQINEIWDTHNFRCDSNSAKSVPCNGDEYRDRDSNPMARRMRTTAKMYSTSYSGSPIAFPLCLPWPILYFFHSHRIPVSRPKYLGTSLPTWTFCTVNFVDNSMIEKGTCNCPFYCAIFASLSSRMQHVHESSFTKHSTWTVWRSASAWTRISVGHTNALIPRRLVEDWQFLHNLVGSSINCK